MSAAVWIAIGVLLLLVLCGSRGKHSGKNSRNVPVRIDRIHCFDADDHECSACHARFRGKRMVCPRCGVRFAGTKNNDDEFVEEMILWEDDD